MLKSLEINGFKSFAKKSGLDFGARISAIVGPNGSGKSNVAEAFRFVLGEQSIKSLRGKRGEDLIFSGGAEAGRLNRASVKLVFDNIARTLPVDFDEVAIERVVHRDSANEYFINGSPVRLKDITELLASAHIGASGHHIISQGEADRILNSNTKERREMIEDALGLKIYQYKKLESERKLEKTRENMERVASLRREIAPHIRFLKKQVEKIEKGRQLREELVGLYKTYFAREDAYLRTEKARITREMSAPKEELTRLERELETLRATIASSKKENPKLAELSALEARIRAAESDARNKILEIGRLEGEIGSIERLMRKQEESATREDARTVPLRDVESVSREVSQIAADVRESQDISAWRDAISKVTTLVNDVIARYKSADAPASAEHVSYKEDIAGLQAKKAELEKAHEAASAEEKNLRTERDTLSRAIEDDKAETIEAERTVFHVMSRQNELHSAVNLLKAAEDRLTLEDEEYKREMQEASILAGIQAMHFDATAELGPEERAVQHDRRRTIEKMKIRLEETGGAGGEDVLKEYKDAEERDLFLAREMEDLEKSSLSLTQLILELDEKLNTEFRIGIAKINAEFQNFFALMFGGGHASLSLIKEEKKKKRGMLGEDGEMDMSASDLEAADSDEDNAPVREGIDISVNLPNKKIKALMALSGGERSLTSVALLFALSQVNPPPFIILDETDAALDEANSKKYGDMVENLSRVSQLIVITHNRETMSRAGVIYGVTMQSGASKLLSIRFEEALAVAK